MVVVPIEDALVVILHFFDSRRRHAVAAVGVTDVRRPLCPGGAARNTSPSPGARARCDLVRLTTSYAGSTPRERRLHRLR